MAGGACRGGLPARVDAVLLPVGRSRRPRHRRVGVGAALVARVRLRGDGRHRRAGRRDRRAAETTPVLLATATSRSSTPATRCRPATTPSSCASTCTTPPTVAPSCAPLCRPTSTSARSARTSAPPSCCSRRTPAAARRHRGLRRRGRRRAAGAPQAPSRDHPDRRRDPPGRHRARARRDRRHQLDDAGRAGRARSAARPGRTGIVADDPELIAAARPRGRRRRRSGDPHRRFERRTRRLHRPRGRDRRRRSPCTGSPSGPVTRSFWAPSQAIRPPRSWAPPATRSRPR